MNMENLVTLVTIKNNQVVVSSRQVAESFGKFHKDVLENIRVILSTAQNCALLFSESKYIASNGKANPEYLMNRDGFTLLAMSFTGSKAMQWKLKYIEAFNEMEKQLLNPFKVPTTFKEALLLALHQQEQIEKHEEYIGLLLPKASYYDLILKNKSLITVTQISKDYGYTAIAFNRLLHQLNIQYKQGESWFLYRQYDGNGYTQSRTAIVDNQAHYNTCWTQKGRIFLYNFLKEQGVLPVIERMNVPA